MNNLFLILILSAPFIFISCNGNKAQSHIESTISKSSEISAKQKSKGKTFEPKSKSAIDEKESSISSDMVDAQTEPMTKKQLKKAKAIIKKAGDVGDIDAKKIYKMYCTTCHGLKGNLKINGAKDLTKSIIDLENAVAQVYFGKGLMTPFNHILSEQEIVAVSIYAESLRR